MTCAVCGLSDSGTITGGHDIYWFSAAQHAVSGGFGASEAGDENFNMDAIVEGVVATLLQSGLVVSAAAAPATSTTEAAAVPDCRGRRGLRRRRRGPLQ